MIVRSTRNEIKWKEELQALLKMDEKEDRKEILYCMLDDLLYLTSLLDLQGSLISLAMDHRDRAPEMAWELERIIQKHPHQILEKWEQYETHKSLMQRS